MEFITALLNYLQSTFGPALWVIVPFLAFVGTVAQMRLYAKADQPALAALIPVWNVTTFMKVIGRPVWHAVYVILPLIAMSCFAIFDFADLFAFSEGTVGFGAVAISLPVIAISAVVFTVFMIWAHIDLCNSFGRRTVFDYVLVVLLNVLYVLNLGLSYEIAYEGPAYGKTSSVSRGSEAFA
jgi:hypothetical protein